MIKWARSIALSFLLLVGMIVALDLVFPPPLAKGDVVSRLVADQNGIPLRVFPVEDGRWRLRANIDDIDPAFIDALIAIEDKRFWSHPGVDGFAVSRAAFSAIRRGEITSGASTITMQTARLLEPRPRNLGAKFIEMLRALQIERRLSKDEILSLYLTLTPYGGNIEGVRTASFTYFDREPTALSPDQIALLIALPQAPEARRPDRRPKGARAGRDLILSQMAELGLIRPDQVTAYSTAPLPEARHAFPANAWHFSARVASAYDLETIRTTIDYPMQRAVERQFLEAKTVAGPGVQVAGLVVHRKGRAVVASVGAATRNDAGGWLDLTQRARSPGSTLKPLIYALAFDDGIAAPSTRVQDLPARFASYRPENFDRLFRGEITVSDALRHSLNVPAVHLLDGVGAGRYLAALSTLGATPRLPAGPELDPGLALALGGFGMTAEDIAVAFAALADDGVAKPLALTPADRAQIDARDGQRIVSAESAQEVTAILAKSPAPPGRIPSALVTHAPQVAYKTGTSYGYRDAWAAGIAGDYIAVVWVGRPDGAPRPHETGRQAALPILFDLFDALALQDPDGTRLNRHLSASRETQPYAASQRANGDSEDITVLFPPDGAELWANDSAHSFTLSARSAQTLEWYVDGTPIARDANGGVAWQPGRPGFYTLAAVAADGRTRMTRVRVTMPQSR